MRVGVVVLHYRNWPDLRAVLDALPSRPEVSTIVVDNSSDDGSDAAIRDAYPGVEVLSLPVNGGYAAGMNAGVSRVLDAEAYLFLTHECVLAPGALESLVARLEEAPAVGIVGPLLGWRSRPTSVWSGGGGLGRLTARPFHIQDPPDLASWTPQPRDVMWIDGAAMLVRRLTYDAVGGFDEGYFLYDEELELALRARRAGWRVECLPAARAWQEPGMASPYLETRNRLRLLARVPGLRRHLPFAVLDTLLTVARGLLQPGNTESHREAILRLRGARDVLLRRLDRISALER